MRQGFYSGFELITSASNILRTVTRLNVQGRISTPSFKLEIEWLITEYQGGLGMSGIFLAPHLLTYSGLAPYLKGTRHCAGKFLCHTLGSFYWS
jgi:hypothetical protein